MAVNISGLIAVIVFYILILAIGIWAARKTKKANNEDLMLAGRDIGMFVGVFTMTGKFITCICVFTSYTGPQNLL
jgi:high affinity choline transporter 7